MLYLLDANVLIHAQRDYYPLERVPEYWEWLIYQGLQGNIKIPDEIIDEILRGDDELKTWIKRAPVKEALRLREEADPELVARVVYTGYADDISDVEIEKLGRDPFLIAYALADPIQRCVVTAEVRSPKRTRANRRIPDVCADLGVRPYGVFEMLRLLNFRTDWNRR
jgi:hypothetical protein